MVYRVRYGRVAVFTRVDDWLHGGDFTRTSLGVQRIVFATVALMTLPNFRWVSEFPGSMFRGPFGPFRFIQDPPPEVLLVALEVLLSVALVAVLVGWRTRSASFLVSILFIVGNGFTYSFGKIDHNVLFVLMAVPLALAGWGDRLSVDAASARASGRVEPTHLATQWPLRLFALLVGLAFFTGALPKLLTGWLEPGTQAVRGTLFRQFYTHERQELLAPYFLGFDSVVFWELLDIATVVLEAGLLIALLWWRGARIGLAVACLFHVGVLAMMNIAFFTNVVVYGFLVQWDRVPFRAPRWRPAGWVITYAPAWVLLLGAAWYLLLRGIGTADSWLGPLVVVAGAGVSTWYLAQLSRRALRSGRSSGKERGTSRRAAAAG